MCWEGGGVLGSLLAPAVYGSGVEAVTLGLNLSMEVGGELVSYVGSELKIEFVAGLFAGAVPALLAVEAELFNKLSALLAFAVATDPPPNTYGEPKSTFNCSRSLLLF